MKRSDAAADHMRDLAGRAIASGQPLSWYEQLYAQAAAGTASVPWDHHEPMPILTDWLRRRVDTTLVVTDAARAVVIGCGCGDDAEFVAGLGFKTTAFDISPTAVQMARERHPSSLVEYQQADLLALPKAWLRSFDLVVESTTLQCLPPNRHQQAAAGVGRLCATGGTVLVIARQPGSDDSAGPPWLLTDQEIRQVATDGVQLIRLDSVPMNGGPRWVAEFHRPNNLTSREPPVKRTVSHTKSLAVGNRSFA